MKRLVVTSMLWLLGACGRHESTPPPATREGRDAGGEHANRVTLSAEGVTNAGLEVRRLEATQFGPRLAFLATIEGDPQQVARVGARVPGRVVALRAAVGEHVSAGAPLLEVDTIELHQVSTEYLTAIARSRQANDALVRARALSVERVGATQDLRRAEADAVAARATLHEAEEHLHFLGLREADISRIRSMTSHGQTHSIVRAPIEGTVASLSASLGQVLQGSEEIAVVSRLDRVWAAVHVYEQDLARVRVGAHVTLRLAGARDEDGPSGTLAYVSPALDLTTRTAVGRVAVDNPGEVLRLGMSVTALVDLPAEGPTLWLPREAVQTHDGREVVFVRVGERQFEARPVRVGEEQGGRVPLREGLTAGDDVVVRGAFSLRGELERSELEEAD